MIANQLSAGMLVKHNLLYGVLFDFMNLMIFGFRSSIWFYEDNDLRFYDDELIVSNEYELYLRISCRITVYSNILQKL